MKLVSLILIASRLIQAAAAGINTTTDITRSTDAAFVADTGAAKAFTMQRVGIFTDAANITTIDITGLKANIADTAAYFTAGFTA